MDRWWCWCPLCLLKISERFQNFSWFSKTKNVWKHFQEGAGIRKVWPIGPWSDQMVWSFLENFLKTFKVLQRSNHEKGLNWIHRMTELSNPPPFWSELFQIFKKKLSPKKISKTFQKLSQRSNHDKGLNRTHRVTELFNSRPFWTFPNLLKTLY